MVRVEIYQLRSDDGNKFLSLHELKKEGCTVEKAYYNKVWDADLDTDLTEKNLCEKLFEELNFEHPDDYTGCSPSISDVFVVDGVPLFCDEFAFVKLESW